MRRFAELNSLHDKDDLAANMSSVEFEAFSMAEGRKIGGTSSISTFLANEDQFDAYHGLPVGICFGLSALYDWYGPDWEQWNFRTVNVHCRYARFGLDAWESWLSVAQSAEN